jgi:phospholipase C
LSVDKKAFTIKLQAANKMHGSRSVGSPFNIYANGYKNENVTTSSYAVKAGDSLQHEWQINDFDNGEYHLHVYGPNGFYRHFSGSANDPALQVKCDFFKKTVRLTYSNQSDKEITLRLTDKSYGSPTSTVKVAPRKSTSSFLDVAKSHGWYDVAVSIDGNEQYIKRFAGRLENGKSGRTDPFMGREL